jgi:hypothetical protein
LNLGKPIRLIGIFVSLVALFFFQYCAPVSIQKSSRPFDQLKIAELISVSKEQERRVHSLFSLGRLTIKRYGTETELNVLIAGVKNSGKIKIEITHPWGRPVVYILINKMRFQILSFREKRYYHGRLGASDTSGLFPVRLDPEQIWALIRGFPLVLKHNRAISLEKDQIAFLNIDGKKTQIIDFYPQSALPCLMSFPGQEVEVSFSDFLNEAGIYCARKIRLNDRKTHSILTFDLKQIVFNQVIPKAIFELKKPVDFKIMFQLRQRENNSLLYLSNVAFSKEPF